MEDRSTLPPAVQDRLNRILLENPETLDEEDAGFLRARSPYLNNEEKRVFASVLNVNPGDVVIAEGSGADEDVRVAQTEEENPETEETTEVQTGSVEEEITPEEEVIPEPEVIEEEQPVQEEVVEESTTSDEGQSEEVAEDLTVADEEIEDVVEDSEESDYDESIEDEYSDVGTADPDASQG